MTPTELWLPIGAAAFYCYDCARLLWHNELLYVRAGSRWRVAGGSDVRWLGRRVYLPHPLLPQHGAFAVHWSLHDKRHAAAAATTLQPLFAALRPLGWIAVAQAWLLLVALPLISWTLGAGLWMLLLFALFYLLALAALSITFIRRERLSLAPRRFWQLAFDALACAPFSINIVRRITAQHTLAANPVLFAAQEFDAVTRQQTLQLLRARIAEQLAGEDPLPEQTQAAANLLAPLLDDRRLMP